MPLKTVIGDHGSAHKGRGATLNPEGRFENAVREVFDDGWETPPGDEPGRPQTIVTGERVKSIISKNDSPDIPFTLSINPYRGCEHGCIYCYARPSHAYLNLSPGMDFETRLFAKVNAAERLREELGMRGYVCSTITIGANTDPYQPAERDWEVTRSILKVVADCNQPIGIITKNALVERDLDILAPMAEKGLVSVFISVTTLDHDLARRMEPRASAPARRIEAIRRVTQAGVPVGVMVAPIVPFLTDSSTEQILQAARDAGARSAGYVLLRLPYEVKDLFKDWLMHHYPLKAEHVMSRVKQMREGRENDPAFGTRMRGSGEFADLLRLRFDTACKRLGLNEHRRTLDSSQFRPPRLDGQMDLFRD
ncbi:MAG TPA: PA0069 family radical SAM protein [Burkholderiales bacterium]|nr:PA0069 family radical SAM protein [Burkholderiales bacterium]